MASRVKCSITISLPYVVRCTIWAKILVHIVFFSQFETFCYVMTIFIPQKCLLLQAFVILCFFCRLILIGVHMDLKTVSVGELENKPVYIQRVL